MDQQQLIQGVINCVANSLALDVTTVTSQSRLLLDLNADSLDFMDIMFQLEDHFGIKLQKEDLDLLDWLDEPREQATVDGLLTVRAKQQLQYWMPQLPLNQNLRPADLGNYLTIETMALIVRHAMNTTAGATV